MLITDLLSLVVSAHHLDLVVLPDGHGPDAVLLAQLLRQRRAHQHAADVRRRLEVAFALLAPGRGHVLVDLHLAQVKCGQEPNLKI